MIRVLFWRPIIISVSLVLLTMLFPALVLAHPATNAASAHGDSTITQQLFAGYSFYQPGGHIKSVAGNWTVPAVHCPAPGQPGRNGTPRAATWAGLWGDYASLKANTAWLPQTGTVSECYKGSPVYYAFFEMYTGVKDGGGRTYFPDRHDYVNWGVTPWCLPNLFFSDLIRSLACIPTNVPEIYTHPFNIDAGDHIRAEVDYLGPYPFAPTDSEFKLDLENSTRSEHWSLDIVTVKPVDLANIIGQGGLILEDHNEYGGLANFGSASFRFASLAVTGSGPLEVNKWVMEVFGMKLATTGELGAAPAYPFTVTFNCNGCLDGGTCPPPECTKY